MAKITQYSRISHHTIFGTANAGLTFSIPTSEDFTDGTWTNYDLALSEIGVNEEDKKVYIRIDDEIKEFEFVGGTAGAESLSDTLAVGNTTGGSDIVMTSSDVIKSSNGGGQIDLDWGGSAGEVIISTDNGNFNESALYLEPYSATLQVADGGRLGCSNDSIIIGVGNRHMIQGKSGGNYTTTNSTIPPVAISTQNSVVSSGVANTVVLGGSGISATQSDTVYVPDLVIQSDKGIKFGSGPIQTRVELDMGDWDMDATTSINVAHSLSATEWKTIRDVSMIIRNDNDNAYFYDNGRNLGLSQIDSTNIVLTRLTSGPYDGADFDSTSYNRGWVTFLYTPD